MGQGRPGNGPGAQVLGLGWRHMRPLARLVSLCRGIVQRSRMDAELDEELRGYFEELVARKQAAGASPDEARRAAQREMGGVQQVKQAVRESWVVSSWDAALQDVASLAGPAVDTGDVDPGGGDLRTGDRIGDGDPRRGAGDSAHSVALSRPRTAAARVGRPHRRRASPRAALGPGAPRPELPNLGVRGHRRGLGRTASRSASTASRSSCGSGSSRRPSFRCSACSRWRAACSPRGTRSTVIPRSILLSFGLWQRRFGGDPSIVGRTITVNDQPTIVLGVLPSGFRLRLPHDAGIPDTIEAFQLFPWRIAEGPRGQRFLRVVARMKPGVSLVEARQDVDRMAAQLSREFPSPGGTAFTTVGLEADNTKPVRGPLLVVTASVALLLVISAVNVLGVLITRAAARRREIAVRVALGAGLSRILRLCWRRA